MLAGRVAGVGTGLGCEAGLEFGDLRAETRGLTSELGTGCNDVFPQRPQNLVPSANREWQRLQATTPVVSRRVPILLSRLPPFEGLS